jgi:hypothetical protein
MDGARHNNHNKKDNRPLRRLIRGADGRLRSSASSSDSDIGDIWAEQKRIRLAEAIEADKKRADKVARRRQAGREVVFNIGIPKIKFPRFSLSKVFIKKRLLGSVALISVIILFGAGYVVLSNLTKDKPGKDVAGSNTKQPLPKKPDYPTILPSNKSIVDLGGWVLVSPPEQKDPAFAYVDNIGGVAINVTQQLLPDKLKNSGEKGVAELAESFGATHKVKTSGGQTFYIGTASSGPQSVIFSTEQLLILIKSAKKINDSEWANYLDNLR